ncbi:DUF4157 domain-containing protein [Streptomyces sp. NPDC021224]|uniref:eCIS core domain-containing protein n=1 Tax=unclassified Streptomyces TaxID=2593676 RepID=UPI003795B82F
MREQDKTREQEPAGRRPARRATAGGGAPAGGLLAVQGSAGNAAAVRMLRGAGRLAPPGGGVQRSAVHDVLRRAGRPLDTATRTDMEARLGADFSDVRVHDDAAAKASAAEVGARAYTSGSHVVIGEGGADAHTLAHELTHVVQQRSGPVAGKDDGSGLKVSDPSDRFEREAEANATRVMRAPVRTVAAAEEEAQTAAGAAEAVQTAPAKGFVQRVLNHTTAPTTPDFAIPVDTRGRAVRSEILTDGSLRGTPVSQDPPGYDYIRSLNRTSQWIRFHLVNQKAGGVGLRGNLVPASGSDNGRYERTIEKDLKNDVTAVQNTPGAYVYFSATVHYNSAVPTTASPAQLNTADTFVTDIDIVHKLFDPAVGWGPGSHDAENFAFRDGQPPDTRVPVQLRNVTLDQLKAYTGLPSGSRMWDQNDLGFLHSIATNGSRNTEFLGHVANPADPASLDAAFWAIPFSAPRANARQAAAAATNATKFADRITEKNGGFDALDTLCHTIASGLLVL